MKFIAMFMICLQSKFHMLSSSASLVISISLKANYRYHAVTILLFYVLQKVCISKSCIFFEDSFPYKISGPYIIQHQYYSHLRSAHSCYWHDFHTRFNENASVGSRVISGTRIFRYTHGHDSIHLSFLISKKSKLSKVK